MFTANSRQDGIKTLLSMGNGSSNDSHVTKENGKPDSNHTLSSKSISAIALRASLSSPANSAAGRVNKRNQTQIAEAIYDKNKPLVTKSRLDKQFHDTIRDQESLAYFVQYMEACGSVSKHLVRLWIQLDCFQRFSQECGNHDDQFKLDAEGIWEKFLNNGRYATLGIDQKIIHPIEQELNSHKRKIDVNIFSALIKWIEKNMEENYFSHYVKSYYHCKYQVNLLTGDNLSLADILFHDRTLFYFMEFTEFMEHEFMSNCVNFLLMAENCRNAECTKEDLIILYQRFFQSDSPYNLNMSDSIKCQIEQGIERCDKHCFDKAMSILIQYLEDSYFQQFLSSQTFFSYLDETIKAMQISGDERIISRSRNNSGSSDKSTLNSLASSSVFPVTQSSKENNNKNNILGLEDFDAIWKRDFATCDIQMATVDQYGKVFSHFLPASIEATPSFSLSKAVKMFRNNALEEKEKEDYAYKVAQRIVDDVRSVTEASYS